MSIRALVVGLDGGRVERPAGAGEDLAADLVLGDRGVADDLDLGDDASRARRRPAGAGRRAGSGASGRRRSAARSGLAARGAGGVVLDVSGRLRVSWANGPGRAEARPGGPARASRIGRTVARGRTAEWGGPAPIRGAGPPARPSLERRPPACARITGDGKSGLLPDVPTASGRVRRRGCVGASTVLPGSAVDRDQNEIGPDGPGPASRRAGTRGWPAMADRCGSVDVGRVDGGLAGGRRAGSGRPG